LMNFLKMIYYICISFVIRHVVLLQKKILRDITGMAIPGKKEPYSRKACHAATDYIHSIFSNRNTDTKNTSDIMTTKEIQM
uniref:hypothetical protein n=1 Tax=Salmonella enterica TaxID=28901 RepID=UPI001C4E272D